MVTLDATAGNRQFWGYTKRGRDVSQVVFVDRDTNLWNPPNVFADFTKLPFRDDVFQVAIFDPPYYVKRGTSWMFWNPDGVKKRRPGGSAIPHYGVYKSHQEMVLNLIYGGQELARVARRLCLQWGEGHITIWAVLGCLSRYWKEVWRMRRKSRGYYRKGSDVYWVTFVRVIENG